MEKCYEGINIPEQIIEPCGNSYISTDCVTIPKPITYLDLPIGSSQTQVNDNVTLALKAVNERINEIEPGGGDQNNFVRKIFLDASQFPEDGISITTQEVIDAVLALPATQRTILETDSVINIAIGYPGNDFSQEFVFILYELQNQGKGIITAISESNLLLKLYGIDKAVEFGNLIKGKSVDFISNGGTYTASMQSGVISFRNNDTGSSIALDNTLSNGGRLSIVDGNRGIFLNSDDVTILSFNPARGYTINFPRPEDATANGIVINYPIDMQSSGNYTLAVREDIAETVLTVTSALTASILNGNWSTKPAGFRVQCPNISSGAMIYERTKNGWLAISATQVT